MSWNKIDTSKLEQERIKTLERAKSIAEVIKKENE